MYFKKRQMLLNLLLKEYVLSISSLHKTQTIHLRTLINFVISKTSYKHEWSLVQISQTELDSLFRTHLKLV